MFLEVGIQRRIPEELGKEALYRCWGKGLLFLKNKGVLLGNNAQEKHFFYCCDLSRHRAHI